MRKRSFVLTILAVVFLTAWLFAAPRGAACTPPSGPGAPTAAPGWTLRVRATAVSTLSGGEALAADPISGNLIVKSLCDPAGTDLQFFQIAPNGMVTNLGDILAMTNSDNSGIAVNPGVGGGLIVADEAGDRIAGIGLTNPLTNGTLFAIPWTMNPHGNGTGQQRYAPILTQFGTGPTHLVLYFWDSTTSKLYGVDATAPTIFTSLLALDPSTAAGLHFSTAGNHVVYDPNTQTLLLSDGLSNTVMEVHPGTGTTDTTTNTLFSNLPGTSADVHPTSIALHSKQVFVQIGNSIYVANRTGGPLSLVASGFAALTDLVVGNASSGTGSSLFAVDKAANTVYEIPLVGVISLDPNFTPAVLTSGLSGPAGMVFRAPTNDLVTAISVDPVLLVDATTGATKTFASNQNNSQLQVAVRASDGLVAVVTPPGGPINFFNSGGALQGTIAAGIPNACVGGIAFDASGNLFVAAGQGGSGCQTTGWLLYQFAGPNPWTAAPVSQFVFGEGTVIQGLAFSAAPLPNGTLYAISSTTGHLYQIPLPVPVCGSNTVCFQFRIISNLPPNARPSSFAIDPLQGDFYISEFNGGDILRVAPPPPPNTDPPPTIFATGFSNTFGLTFDFNGDLYVTEYNTGKVWKFRRNSAAAAPQTIIQGQPNSLTFTNPNQPDQVQRVFIPPSALFCNDQGNCATKWQAVFVPVDGARLDARLASGSTGDRKFFGGGPVPALSTCVRVPSASPNPLVPTNCLVTLQVCYDQNDMRQPICTVHEPSTTTDLIELTSSFSATKGPGNQNAHFAIDFDTPPNLNTLTEITTQPLDCCSGSGGTKSACSQTFFFLAGPSTFADFSLSAAPSSITVNPGAPASSVITVNPLNSFSDAVNLKIGDTPPGITALFGTTATTTVTPPATSATLNVSAGPFVTPTTFTLVVEGNDPNLFDPTANRLTFVNVTVNSSTSSISSAIASFLNNGCIDNAGIANALTSKLSAAQSAINAGQAQTAINVLSAFKSQVQAQAGKHIANSCTIGGVTFSPASVLLTDAQNLINALRTSLAPDPITGSVVNASGVAVSAATVGIYGSTGNLVATTTTDITGFYYFASTSGWPDSSYTIKVTGLPTGYTTSSAPQTFAWAATGMVFNFTIN